METIELNIFLIIVFKANREMYITVDIVYLSFYEKYFSSELESPTFFIKVLQQVWCTKNVSLTYIFKDEPILHFIPVFDKSKILLLKLII